LQNFTKDLDHIKIRFPQTIDSRLSLAQSQVQHLQNMLESNNPKLKNRVGFAQISKNNKVLDIASLKIDEEFEVQSSEYVISAKVINKTKI